MDDTTPTRATLILRVQDTEDQDSWAEFSEVYMPLIFGFCIKRGLKRADAADVAQEVMRSLSLALGKAQYDPQRGKFRAWLFTAVRNAISTHYRKQERVPLSVAETTLLEYVSATPSHEDEETWEHDYQSQVLAWAMEKIRPEFADRIWRAFEATVIEELSAKEISKEINMSPNAVWVARHRVMKRLKEKVHSIDEGKWEQEMIRECQSQAM
ncbi:MAG: sigma-70 family RNA polymerase sigma factor [Verrucomicrobiales bacterium]|nr:sigma-70 family RNA polymerase sigma factor [Verrucomicrobiae bacterium]